MAAEPRPGWAERLRGRLGTVRVRATVGAVLVVGIALLAGSIALVTILRDTLANEAAVAARSRAEAVATGLESSEGPVTLPDVDEDEVIQVLDRQGDVVASTSGIDGLPPLARLRPGESAEIEVRGDDDDFVAAAAVADTPAGTFTVIFARSLADVTESALIVTGLLAVGLPALLLLVALTTWRVVGRALAPVEAIRSEVDEISAAELHRRVPTPTGWDEISRLSSTMNRMLGRLEDSQVRQRRFVSDASHELRSPVASIRQSAEVALAHPDRTTVRELAETVLAEDLRVQRLVEDLLILARADERTRPAGDRPVDLDDIVFEEAERLRDTTRLRVDTAAVSAGRVRGDPAQLRRMIRNLADNAARHSRSRIEFSLSEQENGSVVLVVDDDGAGIPADARQRIFERFVRLDDARGRDHGGSGLGLAIVAEVAAAHGGTATATESPAGGARFEVRLPLLTD